jgi:hypothetical protein
MPLLLALETIMSDLENTVRDGEEGPSEDRSQTGPSGIRSGRAIAFQHIVNKAVLPSETPCSDDCYTTLLHNPDDDPGSSSGKRSGKRAGGYYTNAPKQMIRYT